METRNKYIVVLYNRLDSVVPMITMRGYDLEQLLNSVYKSIKSGSAFDLESYGKLIKAIKIEIFVEVEIV